MDTIAPKSPGSGIQAATFRPRTRAAINSSDKHDVSVVACVGRQGSQDDEPPPRLPASRSARQPQEEPQSPVNPIATKEGLQFAAFERGSASPRWAQGAKLAAGGDAGSRGCWRGQGRAPQPAQPAQEPRHSRGGPGADTAPVLCIACRSPSSATPTSPRKGINSFFRSSIQKLGLGGGAPAAGPAGKKAGGSGAQAGVSVVNPMFEEGGELSAADLVAVLSEASEVFSDGGEVGGFKAAATMGGRPSCAALHWRLMCWAHGAARGPACSTQQRPAGPRPGSQAARHPARPARPLP
jgi:hypothetical protein